MNAKFEATTITHTDTHAAGIDVTLCDKSGRTTTLVLPRDVARALGAAMSDAGAGWSANGLTKRPRTFSVGTGRHDSVVLVRFDDDVPYGIPAATAVELAAAILDGSEAVERRPQQRLQ